MDTGGNFLCHLHFDPEPLGDFGQSGGAGSHRRMGFLGTANEFTDLPSGHFALPAPFTGIVYPLYQCAQCRAGQLRAGLAGARGDAAAAGPLHGSAGAQ